MTDPITSLAATELRDAIHARRVTCREVMAAYLARIARLNPVHNAIVSLRPEEDLLAEADARDAELASAVAAGRLVGPLHGFPHAVKDLVDTAGIRTTSGSPIFADRVPDEDALMVARLKRAGAIVIGKTNVPEFGLGSQTYNPVFGTTRNAIDPSRTSGGSSGGAAVAVALGMLPVADGSDMMGSLRNPAAFNGIVGFRPSAGRVPSGAPDEGFLDDMSTEGPIARTVADLALLLSVQAGPAATAPLALPEPGEAFAAPLDGDPRGLRVGWLGDLGGTVALEPGIREACEAGLARLEGLGCHVEPVALGFAPERAWSAWTTLRSWLVAASYRPLYEDARTRSLLKPEVAWEIERGLRIAGTEALAADAERTALFRHLVERYRAFDVLVLPTAQVWPFDAALHWPREIAGRAMDTYHRWMEVTIYASLAGLPALSVPVGRNPDGVPTGMQLIGRPRADLEVLRLGRAYERTLEAARPAPGSGRSRPGDD